MESIDISFTELQKHPEILKQYDGQEVIYRIYDNTERSYIGYSSMIYFRFSNKYFGYLHPKPQKSLICSELASRGFDAFRLEILPYDLDHDEFYYIIKYDAYLKGYNQTPNGVGGFTNSTYEITKDNLIKTVPYSDLKKYLNDGWVISRK